MMSVRCVCWCATCGRHTHMKINIFMYISFWSASVRMRAPIAGSTLVKTRAAQPDPNCTRSAEKPMSVPILFETQQSIFRLSRVVCFMAVRKRFAGDPTQLPQLLAAHITSPTCVENCADRKHAQKRIVKHADLLLDLRALWPKLSFASRP